MVERDVDVGLLALLSGGSIDVVWPLLHGASGEDGAIRGVLDLLGVPYVGSAPAGCRTAWDKPVAGSVARAAGLLVPDSVALPHGTFRELGAQAVLAAITDRFGLPLVVKPARGGSALGVSVVRSLEDLPRAMVECFAYGDVALVERYISGVEVAVSVVEGDGGTVALPAVEIVPDGGFYSYDARYVAGSTEFFCPARLTAEAATAASEAALTAHRAFGLRHLSRTDLVVDEDRPALVPRGERRAGHDRDLAAAPGRRGVRRRPREALPVAGRAGDTGAARPRVKRRCFTGNGPDTGGVRAVTPSSVGSRPR